MVWLVWSEKLGSGSVHRDRKAAESFIKLYATVDKDFIFTPIPDEAVTLSYWLPVLAENRYTVSA